MSDLRSFPSAGAPEGGARVLGDDDGLAGPGPRVQAAGALAGCKVSNRQGEDLGLIEEIMIDVPTGRIAYAVLSFGGVLGIGDKLFAIPWDALTLDAGRRVFLLDVARDRLQRACGFDKDHWPSLPDPTWTAHPREAADAGQRDA